MAKKRWLFQKTIRGEWATIVVKSNLSQLGDIIETAYNRAVKGLNKKERRRE